MRYLKSYLPTHSVFHKFAAQYLCSFADAIRTERAEASSAGLALCCPADDAIRTERAEARFYRREEGAADMDAIRTERAEAKDGERE